MTCKPDIISVTETWIKPHSLGPFLNLAGYNLFPNSRPTCEETGVFYVRDTIEFHLIDKLTIIDENLFKSICINLAIKNEIITYGTIYRSPLCDSESHQFFS